MACNCAGGQSVEKKKWIYQDKSGTRFEVASEAEARIKVSQNGGGTIYPKP